MDLSTNVALRRTPWNKAPTGHFETLVRLFPFPECGHAEPSGRLRPNTPCPRVDKSTDIIGETDLTTSKLGTPLPNQRSRHVYLRPTSRPLQPLPVLSGYR
jgi:hypothetical protein